MSSSIGSTIVAGDIFVVESENNLDLASRANEKSRI
jgi:hypothetical protein